MCILVALMILLYSAGGCKIKNDDLPIMPYGGEIHVAFCVCGAKLLEVVLVEGLVAEILLVISMGQLVF